MQAPDPSAEPAATDSEDDDLSALVQALIGSRRSVAPKRLFAPGPTDAQLQQLVEAALCAPDHHALAPWRLVRIGDQQRDTLADLFEACSRERSPPPTEDDVAKARAKAYRAPLLLLAVLKSSPADDEVPPVERAVTLGGALMAMLLAAHGMGFGAMLTSGRAVRSARFARAFALGADEQAVCFVSVGSGTPKPGRADGVRGSAHQRLSDWQAGAAAG